MDAKRNADALIVADDRVPWGAGEIAYQRNAAGEIDGMSFGCPCGCRAVYGASWGSRGPWKWNGNADKPTVRESLGCYESRGQAFHWHGYLTDGRFEEC